MNEDSEERCVNKPFRLVLGGAIVIVLASCAFGVAFDVLTRPVPIPMATVNPKNPMAHQPGMLNPAHARVPQVPLSVAKQMYDRKAALFLDARMRVDYDKGHIKGALSLPVSEFDKRRKEVLRGVPKDARIIVYCNSESCGMSATLTEGLLKKGYKQTRDYAGGWIEWCKNKYPIVGAPAAAPPAIPVGTPIPGKKGPRQ